MSTSREWLRGSLSIGLVLGGLALTRDVRAKGLAGASELQLKSSLFSYTSSKSEAHVVDPPAGGALPPPSTGSQTNTTFGLSGTGSGVNYGYFITDHLEVGAGLSFSHGHFSDASFRSDNSSVGLTPRLEYAFGSAAVRPYVAGFGGYQYSWSTGASPEVLSKSHTSGLVVGAAVGAHLFINDSWSLDPELSLQRYSLKGGGSFTGVPQAAGTSFDNENTYHATIIGLMVGISGWFGGR